MTDANIARQIVQDPDVAPEFTEMAGDAFWIGPHKKDPGLLPGRRRRSRVLQAHGPRYESRNALLRPYGAPATALLEPIRPVDSTP